jgi:hypothetical protein
MYGPFASFGLRLTSLRMTIIFRGRNPIDHELIAHPPFKEGFFAAPLMGHLHQRRLPEC